MSRYRFNTIGLLIIFFSFSLNTSCQESNVHQPNKKVVQSATIKLNDCEGGNSKNLDLAIVQMAERLLRAEIQYQSIQKDNKNNSLILNLIEQIDNKEIKFDRLLTQNTKLKMISALRNSDTYVGQELIKLLKKEEAQDLFQINEVNKYNYYEAIIGTCSITNFDRVKSIFDQYRDDLTIDLYWQLSSGEYEGPDIMLLYASRKTDQMKLSNEDIESAESAQNEIDGSMVVKLHLSPFAANVFENMTAKAAADNMCPILIIIDGDVISTPAVTSAIAGGRVNISGGFTLFDTQKLADQLRPNNIPCDMELIRVENK